MWFTKYNREIDLPYPVKAAVNSFHLLKEGYDQPFFLNTYILVFIRFVSEKHSESNQV